jgi:ATP-dependent Zn protease
MPRMTYARLPSRVAVHEAGHCLCLLVVGIRVSSATVEPSGRYAGSVLHSGPCASPADPVRWASVIAAGRVAEEMVFGDADGLEYDERAMRELERLAGRPVAALGLNHAERLLWPRRDALLALARELDRCGTMTGAEVEASVGGAG